MCVPFFFLLKLRVTSNTTVSSTGFQPRPNTLRLLSVPFNMFGCVHTAPSGATSVSTFSDNTSPVRGLDSPVNCQHLTAKPPFASISSVSRVIVNASAVLG